VDGSLASFWGLGPVQQFKFLVLGPSDSGSSALMDQLSSLNLEHVSLALLKSHGISRRPASAVANETDTLTLMRKWFFARKPDAGFVLSDFPATLLQARVFDEWLEARDETLTAVFAMGRAPEAVVVHYRSLGFFREAASAHSW